MMKCEKSRGLRVWHGWLPAAVAVVLLAVGSALAVDLDDVLYGVAQVESRGRDLGKHADGVSYGRYGVTYMAVAELKRVRWLNADVIDLNDPATNRQVAGLYLSYLKHRRGSWWAAVQSYNPGSPTYAGKVWAHVDARPVVKGPQLASSR